MAKPLWRCCWAEVLGTFLLVLFGVGSVHVAVLTGALQGLWQVAVVWGLGITIAIYAVGSISGAHLNPAVSIALAAWGRFPLRRVVPYLAAQFAGAFAGAAVLFSMFASFLTERETTLGIRRGEPESVLTAMCYGEYFPGLGGLATSAEPVTLDAIEALQTKVSLWQAILAEALGTAVLALMIFAVTDPANAGRPLSNLAAPFIGLTVSALICVIAPLTQAGFNPARDLAPRLFSSLAGWGTVPWSWGPPAAWLTVYVLAPIAGAWCGGGIYLLLRGSATEITSETNEQ